MRDENEMRMIYGGYLEWEENKSGKMNGNKKKLRWRRKVKTMMLLLEIAMMMVIVVMA